MKTMKLFISLILLVFGFSLFAQDVIVDENFQSFEKQGWRTDTVDCKDLKIDSKANFKVKKEYEKAKVTYKFIRAAVTPDCEAKKTPMTDGVTTGYVEIHKKDGQLIIDEIEGYVSTIEVAASATGDVRGFALYKSVDDGEWVKVGEYIGAKAEGQDAQYGFVVTITINEKDVALKLAPTICGKDDQAFQYVRIHNIKISGK